MNEQQCFKLIIAIVDKGIGPDVIMASQQGGADGGTIINGRGSSYYQRGDIFGIPIEPEKEIIMVVVPATKAKAINEQIVNKLDITEKGRGITIILDIENVVGL